MAVLERCFFLAGQPFRLRRSQSCFNVRYFCSWFLQCLPKVLCCCSEIDLSFLYFCFFTQVFFLSGMMAAWSHGVYICLVLLVQKSVGPSGNRKLFPRIKHLWRSTVLCFFSEIAWLIYFWFSHEVHHQLTQMMSIILSEASEAMIFWRHSLKAQCNFKHLTQWNCGDVNHKLNERFVKTIVERITCIMYTVANWLAFTVYLIEIKSVEF